MCIRDSHNSMLRGLLGIVKLFILSLIIKYGDLIELILGELVVILIPSLKTHLFHSQFVQIFHG